MSTIRATLIATASIAALGMAAATSHRQTGTGPQKLTGPSSISVTAMTLPEAKKRSIIYTYTVQLNQVASTDTVVTLTDVNGHITIPSSVTVPAGSLSKNISAIPDSIGSDRLIASNGFSSAYVDVTVVSD